MPSVADIKPYFKEDIIAHLRAILYAKGNNPPKDYVDAVIAMALSFNITKAELIG